MRRTFTAIATIAILLVFTSSYNSYDVSVDINSFAPNFEISKLGNHFKLSETRGNYVIVNFWTSDYAEARIRNIHYDRFFKSIGKNLSFISVNFDDSDNMFKELVRRAIRSIAILRKRRYGIRSVQTVSSKERNEQLSS